MKLQYWGSGASEGWPALFCQCEACKKARKLGGPDIRTRSQALLDETVLLDFPADTYLHTLRYGKDLSAIRHILITHSHEDHFYPLDMMLKIAPYAHQQEAEQVSVYGNPTVIGMLEDTITESGMDPKEVLRCIRPVTLKAYVPFAMDDYTVTPLLADHIPGEECFVYLIERAGKTLLYAHDTGIFPAETWEYLKGKRLDLTSLDCTFVTRSNRRRHMGLPETAETRKWLLEMGCATEDTIFVINHFSHNIPVLHQELSEEAKKVGFLTAFDGMTVQI